MNALQGIEGRVEWSEIAAPSCGQGEIRIRVAAAGLNRADLLQKAGLYPPPPGASPALGLECAGVVSEVGAGSTWQVGDRVCALTMLGGLAERAVVNGDALVAVPEQFTPAQAAAIGIIGGLREALDSERGGELAGNLDRLYEYMIARLVEANTSNDTSLLDEVSALLLEVKSGWDGISH